MFLLGLDSMDVADKSLLIRDVMSSRLVQTNLFCKRFFTRVVEVDREPLGVQYDILDIAAGDLEFLRPMQELSRVVGTKDRVASFKDPVNSICRICNKIVLWMK